MTLNQLKRKVRKNGLFYRIWMFMGHNIFVPKFEYSETEWECYERNVRDGNAVYVMSPPTIAVNDDEVI